MFMRSFAARHSGDPRTLLLMAPGWVRVSGERAQVGSMRATRSDH
jgi:hypothetical protein